MSFENLLGSLDHRGRVRGKQFERVCQWLLRESPEYGARLRHVWLFDEWPGRWGLEAGVDLMAEDTDGGLWAIQAKAYNASRTITKDDINKFLAVRAVRGIVYRLLIATTNRVGPIARRTIHAQAVPVGLLLRKQLEQAQVDWPPSVDDLRPGRPKPKEPRRHTQKAIDAIVEGLSRVDRGQCLMASGSGKTLVALWSSEELATRRVLVCVPSLSLLAQKLGEWTANSRKLFESLAVCSDPTVASKDKPGSEDELVSRPAELGVPVTTDPVAIDAFLRGKGRRVVFATYQSTPAVAAALARGAPAFDLLIADEAHRTAGPQASEFGTVLDAEAIPAKKRLFLTATPRFFTERVINDAGQLGVEVASMDDVSVYGPVLHRLTFGEAIERRILSDYRVVVVAVTDNDYRELAERAAFVTVDGRRTDARTVATEVGLLKAARRFDLRRVVSFHSRVEAARQYSAELGAVLDWMPKDERPEGSLWTGHVSGEMPSGKRDTILDQFRGLSAGTRGVLTNARCLVEGVDVPAIDGVAFIDPRRSTIDIIQAVGRAIRKSPDKKIGTVVLPVFIAADQDVEETVGASAFRHVWDVIKALRAHDEALGEELDELRRELGRRKTLGRRPSKIKLDVAPELEPLFATAFDAQLVEHTTASWEFWFGLLTRFVDKTGHAQPIADHREDGFALGRWVVVQRACRKREKGALTPQRQRRLEELPGWSWEPLEEQWRAGYERLIHFVAEHGHARVPFDEEFEGFPLGQWVVVCRSTFRRARLNEERRALLEKLPGWTWSVRAEDWEQGFAELLRFVERHGVAHPHPRFRQDDFPLGQWCTAQRQTYKAGRLDPERARRLESTPGWTWSARESSWEQHFAVLSSFIEREGHARVPTNHNEAGLLLGVWVREQRKLHQETSADPIRKERLEALPGWSWEGLGTQQWEAAFSRLLRYTRRVGHSAVPYAYVEDGFPLGTWVNSRRSEYRRGLLAEKRIKQLESLPGWVWRGGRQSRQR